GRLAGFTSMAEATNKIAHFAGPNTPATRALASAVALRDSAAESLTEAKYPDAIERAQEAERLMQEAVCSAQTRLPGEFRAFWCHSAFGVRGLDWDTAIHRLADNGFTAI